jgi:hypothetical protein
MITVRQRILGALWGSAIGDALGVPVEFKDRATVQADPVKEFRGGVALSYLSAGGVLLMTETIAFIVILLWTLAARAAPPSLRGAHRGRFLGTPLGPLDAARRAAVRSAGL